MGSDTGIETGNIVGNRQPVQSGRQAYVSSRDWVAYQDDGGITRGSRATRLNFTPLARRF